MANHPIRSWIFALVVLAVAASAFAQIGISVSFGPPPLPVYEQPPCPQEGYIWTPGYWSYDNDYDDYYWVPGTWVMAPEPDLLWTPGYWAWSDGGFRFYDGYWAPQVGFYGGIDYGFGYYGEGYDGGRWDHGHFFYNRAVNNVNVTVIHNVYNTTVINRTTVNRVSYNGGNGGVSARPTSQQEAVARERHIAAVAAQKQHIQEARADRQLRASENHGKPPVAATPRPAAFHDHVVAAKEAGGPYKPPADRKETRSAEKGSAPNGGNGERNNNVERNNNAERNNNHGNATHPKDLPPRDRPAPANTGNAKQDQKYQQQQEKMNARQDQERQKLQQKQEQEHQKIARQNADEAKKQQTEQRHQQQTQQLARHQEQQRQKLEQKQQPKQNRPQTQAHKEQHPPQEKPN